MNYYAFQEKLRKTTLITQHESSRQNSFSWLSIFSSVLIICTAISTIPLQRLSFIVHDRLVPLLNFLPTSALISSWGAWLPGNFLFSSDVLTSARNTIILELQVLAILFFACYLLAALCVVRQPAKTRAFRHLPIWIGAIGAGGILALTPSLPSHDLFVYADYGHVLTTYHSNPFFVAPSAVSHDQLTMLNDWRATTVAYGPLWLSYCALISFFGGDQPLLYLFIYRLLGLLFHLINIGLVTAILRRTRCSSRTVLLGTLLYAWNPLVLLESTLTAHNDIYIITLILVGILLSIRAQQADFLRPRFYLPPLIAFTLTAMIKITAGPLIVCFLLLLAYQAMQDTAGQIQFSRWRQAVNPVALAAAVSLGIFLLFYAPFWFGHGLPEIMATFIAPPSSQRGVNSLFRIFVEEAKGKSSSTIPWWIQVFNQRGVWNGINLLAFLLLLGAGTCWLKQRPTVPALGLLMLYVQAGLLIVTPWFYPWYLIELVALLPILLIGTLSRLGRSMFVFVLAISLTSLLTEYRAMDLLAPLLKSYYIHLVIFVPAICAFIVSWFRKRERKAMPGGNQFSSSGA
jgi:hypothetical protein